ncbi:hypothetical protein QBC47DRAFT_453421 [Echria macrotheca]|uniref:Uncharacterized protein n=1 Tax=Echria macrotheca TaxID=438768 RepID=A0AAJ0F7Q7_9PEZI|nr:hypothetical protein QBC47DRAFT_453421 [Echria macrotheca]
MPLGFCCLHDIPPGTVPDDRLVDIVAVHDVHQNSIDAWTDPQTGSNWLRDFLHEDIRVARILTYGYDCSASALFASDASETIQRMAESLVQELRANRQLAGSLRRPIIFICHGLGGVLVKKSLVYSSTRTAPKVDHLWDQFISTFAIVFFGTPHGEISRSNWLDFEAVRTRTCRPGIPPGVASRSADRDAVQMPRMVDNDFMPLIRHFNLFFFWEQLRTQLGGRMDFLVEPRSAAPKHDNTEAAAIYANHLNMTKFKSRDSSGYRTALAALATYCDKAPGIISRRWKQAERRLQELRRGEAEEIGGFGFDVHLEEPFQSPGFRPRGHHHFHIPRETTPEFVGREDLLRQLHAAFFPGGRQSTARSRKSFVVFGMGGSGKTELCCKFATDYRHEYTAVFTIRASSPETIKESYCDLGRLAGLEPTESAGKHFLSQQEEPWLLIIDNADDPSLNLTNLFPQGGAAHILVTTRVRDFRSEGTLGHLELKGLTEAEALQLLFTKAHIPHPWNVSITELGSKIAQALGYLALALIQAGTCVYKGACDLGNYLTVLSDARETLRAKAELRIKTVNDAVVTVYSTFDVSLSHLMKQVTLESQDAAELLKIIAFFHFERIPLEIFYRAAASREREKASRPKHRTLLQLLFERLEPPRPLPAFLKGTGGGIEKHRVNFAIAELQSLSFIRSDGKYISLHPLIHSWARDSLNTAEGPLWAAVALNTLAESVSLPPDSSTETDGDFHRDLVPHLDACLKIAGNPISNDVCSPTWLLILRHRVQMHAKFGWVFAERGHFKEAAAHLDIVRSMLTKMVGERDERTVAATLGLAGAIDLLRSVVDTRSQLYGPNDERTLQAQAKLASALWLHGHHQEALDLQQATWSTMRDTLGETHPETLATLDQLESLEAHRFVLYARTKALGDTHPQTLETKSNMAMALLDLGQREEAKKAITEVFGQRQRQLGKEHPWTLWALCYLAKVDVELGLLSEAEVTLTWGIEAALRSLSDDHLGIYARTDRLDEAEKLCGEIIARAEKARGSDHPDCVYALWRLARLYVLKGSRQKAIDTCQAGLERADKRITREHPHARDLESLLRDLEDTSKPLALPDVGPEDVSARPVFWQERNVLVLFSALSMLQTNDHVDTTEDQRALQNRSEAFTELTNIPLPSTDTKMAIMDGVWASWGPDHRCGNISSQRS